MRIAWNKGLKWSEESKKKMSVSHTGKILSDEHKKRIGIAGKGLVRSDETKKRMSVAQKGLVKSEEHKRKIGLSLIGKPGRNTGHRHTEEARRKISIANMGHKMSEETRRKISGENAGRWKGGVSSLPTYSSFKSRHYKLKKKTNGGSHTLPEWLALKIKYGFMCLCCKKTEPEIKLTEDHIVPISKGGKDTIDNIQPLCFDCNRRKWARTINYIEMANSRSGFASVLLLGIVALVSVIGLGFYTKNAVEKINQERFGSTILTTDLASTINSFRTNVNTSLSNLSSDLANATATIGTYGTIVTANSPLSVANGGTSLTSGPANSSQFLGASGTIPFWRWLVGSGAISISQTPTSTVLSSAGLDTTANFAWTGTHSFASSTTFSTSTSIVAINLIPPGVIQMYASTTAPEGWLLADGSAVATSSYPKLFAVIGYQYGGSTSTFALPNFKGRNPIGVDASNASTTPIGSKGGEQYHTQTLAELAAHSHIITLKNQVVGSSGVPAGADPAAGGATSPGSTNTTGSSTPFSVLDPYISVNFIIKY